MVQVRAEGPKAPSPGLGAFALYLSLRPVTVGSGRVELTCDSSVIFYSLILKSPSKKSPIFAVSLHEMRCKKTYDIIVKVAMLVCLVAYKILR